MCAAATEVSIMVKTTKSKRVQNSPAKRHPEKGAATKPDLQAKRQMSKKDNVIALLRQPEGTTIKAMMKATGWQSHSVRGFLAGTLSKKLKLKLQSEKVGGERVYRLGRLTKGGASTQPDRQG
jgi:uncharacterized protein DUF3489